MAGKNDQYRAQGAPKFALEGGKTYKAKFETSMGDFEAELYSDTAPMTVNSFVFLANEGFYDGVGFHRVVPGFVVQGGDRGLHLVWPGSAGGQRVLGQSPALGDPVLVPARSILRIEQDQGAVGVGAGLPPRIVQQHERQEPGRLGFVGEQRDDEACQPDRLGTQFAADERVAG